MNLRDLFPYARHDIRNLPVFPALARSVRDYFDIAERVYEPLAPHTVYPPIQCWSIAVGEVPATGYYGAAFLDLRLDGLLGPARPELIIAHRGTDDWKDISEADVSIYEQRIPKQFDDAALLTESARGFLGEKNLKTVHVGHSLGAALAQMLAYRDGQYSIGFETPGTTGILARLRDRFSGPVDPQRFLSFNVVGSYVSEALPQVGVVSKCIVERMPPRNPKANVEKLHRMKNIRRCFDEIGRFKPWADKN